jgi:hypothetical protein
LIRRPGQNAPSSLWDVEGDFGKNKGGPAGRAVHAYCDWLTT